MIAVVAGRPGGPEVLTVDWSAAVPVCGSGEDLLRVEAAGVNYADLHMLKGTYFGQPAHPFVPGGEAVGWLPNGRRVALLTSHGCYASLVPAHRDRSVAVPDGLEAAAALGLMTQGLTAYHLCHTSASLRGGETVLVHGGAGGVGSLLIQFVRLAGAATIVSTCSTAEKRRVCERLGADIVLDSTDPNWAERARSEARNGYDIVFEMVGGNVFKSSLALLAPFGRLVTFGNAGRELPTRVSPLALLERSRTVTGFWLRDCMDSQELFQDRLRWLFAEALAGRLEVLVDRACPLTDAEGALHALAARKTIGKVTLNPPHMARERDRVPRGGGSRG